MDFNKVLSYSDYQRLRSTDLKLWSENDLARFLVLDCFIIPNEATWVKDAQKLEIEAQRVRAQKYISWKLILNFPDKVFLNFYIKTKKQSKKNILFQDSRYNSIIFEAKKHYHAGLITEGRKDRLFAINNFLGYMGMDDLEEYVFSYLKERNINYLYQLIKKAEDKLRVANPDYIVLRDDCSPIARAIILAGRKLGITTAVIQHGAYSSYDPMYNCKAAEYVFVWGKYFRDFFVEQGIRMPEDIYILGYPYPIKKNILGKSKPKFCAVCYLGQNFEKYNKDLLQIKLENVRNISETCKKLGFEFFYRPHPADNRESLQEKLLDIQFTAKKEKLEETFLKADIFVGFNSTSLVEAAMRQKICLQLMNYPMETDNFEELGACSKSFKNIVELKNYLEKIADDSDLDKFRIKFNNDYMETRYNPGRRFLEIIKEIKKKKKL